ncbi:MAG: phenylalanine--tRNA ligase subunit beta [Candidatus Aenigmarchaeota archaeon]|nr:phenylalanine--tRNA ligase subunit beta [Candidatus Aenigmarchaeota archaeon]
MPTIEISYADLCRLAGRKIPVKELETDILYVKGEIESREGDRIKIDIKDTNRPDLWSTEGMARELRAKYGATGLPKYSAEKPKFSVPVDTRSPVQPLAACAVARNLRIDENFLSQIVQLQEKLGQTFGRNRRELSMGIYDLDRIMLPIKYTSMKPGDITFTPLGSAMEMTAREILSEHPKGREFGRLLADAKEYPVWVDGSGAVLSMPPVINSEPAGNVGGHTRNAFMECTGYNVKFLDTVINVLAMQMADRGASIEAVETAYAGKKILTPGFSPKKMQINISYINKLSGLNLTPARIIELLRRSNCNAIQEADSIVAEYPSYRQDIMHPVDIIEDIIIAYGYNRIEPAYPRLATSGSMLATEKFSAAIAEVLGGLGFQEVMNYTLTSNQEQFDRMGISGGKAVEIENYMSENWSAFRAWLLPGLLSFLSTNQHSEFPQKICELGNAILPDESAPSKARDVMKLACAITGNAAGYEDISGALDAAMRSIGIKYKLSRTTHNSFIEGRAAAVLMENKGIGHVGEIHPNVLNNFGIERPVACFEVDISRVYESWQQRHKR